MIEPGTPANLGNCASPAYTMWIRYMMASAWHHVKEHTKGAIASHSRYSELLGGSASSLNTLISIDSHIRFISDVSEFSRVNKTIPASSKQKINYLQPCDSHVICAYESGVLFTLLCSAQQHLSTGGIFNKFDGCKRVASTRTTEIACVCELYVCVGGRGAWFWLWGVEDAKILENYAHEYWVDLEWLIVLK